MHVEIVQGAGAFVCGEETALISSMEGKRGMARNKPPYPAEVGFYGHPTCVNNVETFANVPLIIDRGVDWYRSVGTVKSPGTKCFSLSGKVKNTGLVEVPIGTHCSSSSRSSAAAPKSETIKGAQTGGPSGGCIPADRLDTPVDYENLRTLGGMMGSGGMVVTDSGTCMVAFAKFFLGFTQHESCGKCIPCREGTKRMLEILERITDGKGQMSDIAELQPPGPRHLAHLGLRPGAVGAQARGLDPALLRGTSTFAHPRHCVAWPACAARCSPTASWPTAAAAPCARAAVPSSASAATGQDLRHRQRPLYQVRRLQPGLSLRRRGANLSDGGLAMTDVTSDHQRD